MDLLGALRGFALIVETGSLSAAARRSATSQSAMTRQLGELERHFGVRLLHRSTRRLSLTQDGEDLLGRAHQLLATAAEMEDALGQSRDAPTGHVRLGTSVAFGVFLAARLPVLLARHPGLSVELVMGDRMGNMIEDRLDLATLAGEVTDTSLVVRSMGQIGRLPVAAPSYLARAGTPTHPDELARHDCLVHDTGDGRAASWTFNGPGGRTVVAVTGLLTATVGEAVLRATLAGCGIAMLQELQVADELRAGRLVRLLPDWQPLRIPVVLAYPSRRHLAPRTRVVLEFVMQTVTELRTTLAGLGEEGQGSALDPPGA